MAELEAQDAVMHDQHLVLASMRHGSDYINLDFMYPNMEFMSNLGHMMAMTIYDHVSRHSIDALVAPATGGVALLQWVGLHLRAFDNEMPLLFWADKVGDKEFAFERARWRQQLDGLRVAGVEDIVTSGGSIRATMDAATAAGASPEIVMAVCNRQGATAKEVGAKAFFPLMEVDYPSYSSDDCPMCKAGVPVAEDIGRGDEFKKTRPDYAGGYVKLLG